MGNRKELLDKIHELLVQDMLDRLNNGSAVRNKDGELVVESLSAAELNVIRQFLKDNGVDKALPEDNPDDPFKKLVRQAQQSIPEALRTKAN